jgi:hypothetical protein
VRHAAAQQVLRALAIVAVGVGLVCLVQYLEFASVMFEIFSGINSSTDLAKNQRGDEVKARTISSGRWQDPDRTVVRLRPTHHWFWTTLVETESFGVREDLKWKNDDQLDVTLGFGCLTYMSGTVDIVGSVHIAYHFSSGDGTLATGCPD